MIQLKTITMQLIDGDPDGIRICRVEGETLVTIIIPRAKLSVAKRLPEIPDRGIYYLLDEDHGVISRVYTGQTTQGVARLDTHKTRKGFWNKAVMFLTDSQNMSQDVVAGLEAKAIEYVNTHGSYEAENSVEPKPYISPYSESAIERLHDSILFRMAALGYDLNRAEHGPNEPAPIFQTKKNKTVARGKFDKATGKFTVLAGSEVALDRRIIKNQIAIRLREEIFGDSTGKQFLLDDVVFSSPSTAAVFVLGGSQNGWTEWTNDDGKTLHSVYREAEEE